MAKKDDDIDFGMDDLDNFNFGDLDSDDPFGGEDSFKDNRKPAKVFIDSVKDSQKERLLDPGLLRRLVSLAMPKGYSQVFTAYDALNDAASKVYNDNAAELTPYMRQAKIKYDRMSPAAQRLLPKAARDALDNVQQETESYTQKDELTTNLEGIEQIFAGDKADRNLREATTDLRDRKRFQVEMEARLDIGKGIGRLVGYQDKILINWHRKTLEIGYRGLDIQYRMLKAQQEHFGIAKNSLAAIQKNTGLPDFVKLNTTEVIKQQLSSKLASAAMGSAGGWARNYFKGLQDNASQILGSAIDFHKEIGSAEQFGMSRSQMFGSMLGNMASELLTSVTDKGLDTAAGYVAPLVEKIPGVKRGGDMLRNALTGVPQRLNEYAKSETSDEVSKVRWFIEEGAKALLDQYSTPVAIAGTGIDNLDKPALFDNLVHKSITEIMPGYMASMDRSLKMLVSGEDVEETAYSHYSGGFVDRSVLNQQHVKIALKNNAGQGLRTQVDSLLRDMGASDLSLEAKRALRVQLMKDMQSANDFKPERYTKIQTWNHVPEEIGEELIDFFADTFGIDAAGKRDTSDVENNTKFNDVRDSFLELSSRVDGYSGRMGALSSVIGRRSWRELGLSDYNGINSDIVNLPKLYDMLVNGDDDTFRPEAEKEKSSFSLKMSPAEMAAAAQADMKSRKRTNSRDATIEDIGPQGGDATFKPGKIGGAAPARSAAPPIDLSGAKVTAEVQFPDLQMVSDQGTYDRLDEVMDVGQQQNQWLEYILEALLNDSEGDGGGPRPAGPAGEDGEPNAAKRTRRGLLGRAWGAAKWTGRMTGKYFKNYYKLLGKGTALTAKLGWGAAKLPFKNIDGLGISDVYTEGSDEPAMAAKDIRKGYFVDVGTGKKIEKLKDITGAVKDLRTGNLAITAEEFEKGLFSGEGESLAGWVGRRGLTAGLAVGRGIGSYFSFTYGTMFKIAKKIANITIDQFTQYDAYFPGDDEPRLTSKKMAKGAYRNKDGTVITSLKDISGPIFEMDAKGNLKEIVSQDEIDQYKSFYTVNGSLLFTFGRGVITVGKAALSAAFKGAKWYAKKVGQVYGAAWKGVKAVGRGLGRFVKNRFKSARGADNQSGIGMLDEELAHASVEIQHNQLEVQQQILAFMKSKWDAEGVHGDVDGDGVAENSWTDILRKRKEKLAAKMGFGTKSDDPTVQAIKDLQKNLDGKLDELIDTTEEAGESSLLEDAADLSELKGDKHGRKGRGRGGKRGFKSGRGIRGKIGNMGRSIGRGLGRIPGAGALGRGLGSAGGMIGRAAMSTGGLVARGAMAALPFVGSAAATVGTVALEGAAALLGFISLPVVLGVAAVAGVGYLGYKWYKSEKAKDFPLLYLRMTQYGVNPTNETRVQQVLQLEGILKSYVKIGKDGTTTMDPPENIVNDAAKIFGINDNERMAKLANWVGARFRPVYLAHCTAMSTIRGTTDLSSSDTGIGDGDLDKFLSIVDLGGMAKVYDDDDNSPFDGDLETDADDVVSAVKMVRERRKDKADNKAETVALAATAGNAALVAKNTTLNVAANGTSDAASIAKGIVTTSALGFGAQAAYKSTSSAKSASRSLDIPTAVRYKAYGLVEMNLAQCEQLQKVEDVYLPNLQFSGNDKAMPGGNPDDLAVSVEQIFKPGTPEQREDMLRWLNFRFMPVFLQYAISVRRRYNGDIRNASQNLTGALMKEVLDETTRAMADTPAGQVSIWTIANSPWPGVALESMAGSVKAYMDAINTNDETKVLSIKGMEAQSRAAPSNNDYSNILKNTALGNTRANPISPGVGQTGPTLANMKNIYSGKQTAGGATLGTGALLYKGSFGSQVQHPGGGTGGDINSLPNGSGKGAAAMSPIITGAAKMVGFDPTIAMNVAGVESRFDPDASSGIATGLFQFVKGTWSDMLRKYGPTYGIAANTPPTDARANAILGVCYLKENYEGLQASLGGNVSDVDLYAAHFLGLGGAKKLLTAPRDSSSADVVSAKAIANNASVFYSGGRLRNVGEVMAELDRRVNVGRKLAGNPESKTGIAETPESNVPGGNPTGAVANGGNASDPESPYGEATGKAAEGAGSLNDAMGNDPVAANTTAAAAGAAVSAGSGAAPTASPSAPVTPDGISASGAETTPATQPVSQPTSNATAAAAQQSQRSTSAESQAAVSDVSSLLTQHLELARSMDTSLKSIDAKIQALAATAQQPAAPVADPGPPKPKAAPEPVPRVPLFLKRPNAVLGN